MNSHPLVEHWLTIARNKETTSYNFRKAIKLLCRFLAYRASETLFLKERVIDTLLQENVSCGYLGCNVVLVPILRAGLAMMDEFLDILPKAEVNLIGMERVDDVNSIVKFYYQKTHISLQDKTVIILDPMIATATSLIEAIKALTNNDSKIQQIIVSSVLMSDAAKQRLLALDMDLKVYTCACDTKLNENNFIVPGLGDAGDRYFNT